ncbi:MAG: SCO family protein [Betaproteobacteria bacterium]
MRRLSGHVRTLAWITGLLLAAMLAGCGQDAARFRGSDISGASFGHDFDLTDHNGQRRTLADFHGKVVVLFFGYTHCPDVCPTTLAGLAQAMKELGDDAQRVQVLFATVDPERDSADLLALYVPAFNPAFLGLRGDPDATARVTRDFKVLAQKQPGGAPGSYTVDHSAGTFIFDPQGRLRLYVAYGQDPAVFTHDIRALLDAG